MREMYEENLSAREPLTLLNEGEVVRYVRCNLTNRRVAPGSSLHRCQTVQIVFDGDDAHIAGSGVLGEVTDADVQAVRDRIGGDQ